MKTMKEYNVPETEVMDLHADKLMQSAGYSIGDGPSGEGDAPARRHVGSLGPSY